MSLTLLLYLVEISHSIDCLLGFFTVIYILMIGFLSLGWFVSNDGYNEDKNELFGSILKKVSKKSWIFIICLFLQIIIPTKTAMYMMLGSGYLTDSNIPSQVSEILNLKLNNILTDLKKNKEE